jgi:zinc protease
MKTMKMNKFWRWLGFSLITISLVFFSKNEVFAQVARNYQEIKYPPLAEIQLPNYDRYQLDNGMVIYLVEDHQLPLIKGNAIIRTGAKFEPANQVGLAEITGKLIRTGGTTKHSEDELDYLLEQKAAAVETEIEQNNGSASFDCLSDDLDEVFALFAEVLRYPVFTEEQLELEKTNLQGEIARRNDNPSQIASREFSKLIYGNNSPYARTTEYQTLANISRQDVKEFYQQYVRPENIILGIVGDFQAEEMKAKINSAFADWKVNTPAPNLQLATPQQKLTEGIYLVDQPQLSQSNILLGHIGGRLDDPNYPALSIINGVLNGFGGRLFQDIRSRQGLAYSVYGFWNATYDYPGIFVAGGQTKSETTTQFIQSIYNEIERLRTQPISQEELDYAKDSILNSFVFKFQTPAQTLSRLMIYEYYDYPQDFIFKYQTAVKNTTVDDVLRVAQQYLQPEQIVTLVVGNQAMVKSDLTNLKQKVSSIDITIPQPAS